MAGLMRAWPDGPRGGGCKVRDFRCTRSYGRRDAWPLRVTNAPSVLWRTAVYSTVGRTIRLRSVTSRPTLPSGSRQTWPRHHTLSRPWPCATGLAWLRAPPGGSCSGRSGAGPGRAIALTSHLGESAPSDRGGTQSPRCCRELRDLGTCALPGLSACAQGSGLTTAMAWAMPSCNRTAESTLADRREACSTAAATAAATLTSLTLPADVGPGRVCRPHSRWYGCRMRFNQAISSVRVALRRCGGGKQVVPRARHELSCVIAAPLRSAERRS